MAVSPVEGVATWRLWKNPKRNEAVAVICRSLRKQNRLIAVLKRRAGRRINNWRKNNGAVRKSCNMAYEKEVWRIKAEMLRWKSLLSGIKETVATTCNH